MAAARGAVLSRVAAADSADGAASILAAPTPSAWVEDALAHRPQLLLDHANCEKKAASTALALMFAYAEDRPLALALSRLAREELRHFERVLRVMDVLGVPFARQRPGRYAQALRSALCSAEPGRKLDLLLMSALIEARSAERFALLAPRPVAARLRRSTVRSAAPRRGTTSCTSALPRASAPGSVACAARRARRIRGAADDGARSLVAFSLRTARLMPRASRQQLLTTRRARRGKS